MAGRSISAALLRCPVPVSTACRHAAARPTIRRRRAHMAVRRAASRWSSEAQCVRRAHPCARHPRLGSLQRLTLSAPVLFSCSVHWPRATARASTGLTLPGSRFRRHHSLCLEEPRLLARAGAGAFRAILFLLPLMPGQQVALVRRQTLRPTIGARLGEHSAQAATSGTTAFPAAPAGDAGWGV